LRRAGWSHRHLEGGTAGGIGRRGKLRNCDCECANSDQTESLTADDFHDATPAKWLRARKMAKRGREV
jgi:hypothetical protein